MAITFQNTELKGLIIIHPHVFSDERGIYMKCYEQQAFLNAGIMTQFTETSDIYSVKGTLRGLHYQQRFSQAKLLHVIQGRIFDVALDLRRESSTFGKYHTEIMDSKDSKVMYIPEGFAHAFVTLSDEAIFSYQCSGKYDPDSCGGILWNDPELNIPWPLQEYGIDKVIATEKDQKWPTLKEYCEKIMRM